MTVALLVLCIVLLTARLSEASQNGLPFLQLNSSADIETRAVGHYDDGVSQAIHIQGGFPFEGTLHDAVYIGTNGIISFDEPMYFIPPHFSSFPTPYNDIRNHFLVAPFWDDVDIRKAGNIFYEVHTNFSGNIDSKDMLSVVSHYIEEETGETFSGEWMLVVMWDQVHPWPHGLPRTVYTNYLFHRFLDFTKTNTWQAILITDGTSSYSVFTYECGSMGWSRLENRIGFNAAGIVYENHPMSGKNAKHLSCINMPESNWTNVLYDLTNVNINVTEPSPYEPPQTTYLPPLSFLGLNSSGTLDPCRNCTSGPINLEMPIPFGYYYHERAYVGVNGIISFDREFSLNHPKNFPSMEGTIYYSYLVAPFWSDVDTRRAGSVCYETYTRGDSETSDKQIRTVEDFLTVEQSVTFSGEWMMLVSWEDVHRYPHGSSADLARENPDLELTNTFQAVIISDFNKTYTIFTYECDSMEWSDEATIGFNAAGDFHSNHPLSGRHQANAIGCVHTDPRDEHPATLNNVIYDLVPSTLNTSIAPIITRTLGRCVVNYTDCCTEGDCFGSAEDCMCDIHCHIVGDCCSDINSTCLMALPPNNDAYLIFAHGALISQVDTNGDYLHPISRHPDQYVNSIDFDYRRGIMFWTDLRSGTIFKSNLDGSNATLLRDNPTSRGGIAVDWIGNNIYWTGILLGNIQVLNLNTLESAIVVNTGQVSHPSGIAVDPITRELFWTDWGTPNKIEKASMDGSNRQILHSTDLITPEDIALDHAAKRIYWADGHNYRIESSNYDGSDRQIFIEDGEPVALTLAGNLVFWSDWNGRVIKKAHKSSDPVAEIFQNFTRQRPFGIKFVSPDIQAIVANPCENSNCSHICLLSNTSDEFKCICPIGFELHPDGTQCEVIANQSSLVSGSCVAAGFTRCCSVIVTTYCAGSEPSNCFCDSQCRIRGDCCQDIDETCPINGTCAGAGFQGCCNIGFTSSCSGSSGDCWCDSRCYELEDCCPDINSTCSHVAGTCSDAGYTECCETGDCSGSEGNCKCDAACRDRADCCQDIDNTCPTTVTTDVTTVAMTPTDSTTGSSTASTSATTRSMTSSDTRATISVSIVIIPSLKNPSPGEHQSDGKAEAIAGGVIGILVVMTISSVMAMILVLYRILRKIRVKSSSYSSVENQRTKDGNMKSQAVEEKLELKSLPDSQAKDFENPIYEVSPDKFEKDDLALI